MSLASPSRKIQGLRWVRETKNPWPKAKLSGLPAQGMRFQNRIAKALLGQAKGSFAVTSNPWFEFCDRNGIGLCSPDILLNGPSGIVVIECKLTYTERALEQLFGLYLPVVELFFGVAAKSVVVVGGIGREQPLGPILGTLRDAIFAPKSFPGLLEVPPATIVSPLGLPLAHVRRQFSLGN
jgi:hypothetical protein